MRNGGAFNDCNNPHRNHHFQSESQITIFQFRSGNIFSPPPLQYQYRKYHKHIRQYEINSVKIFLDLDIFYSIEYQCLKVETLVKTLR